MADTTFNPSDKTRDIKGKDYLDVKWRIQWYRADYPLPQDSVHAPSITTELLQSDPYHIVKATVAINGEVIATGHGTAPGYGNGQSTWKYRELEKAETAAIGRALGHAGFGTAALEEDGDHLADSPSERDVQDGQEGASNPTTQVQVIPTKKGSTMNIIGGASMFTRDPLRELGFETDWLEEEAKPGDYQLPDPVTVVYRQNGKYKNILRIRRDSTGEVVHVKAG